MDVASNEMYGKSWADLTESERQWLLLDTVEKTYEMNGAMGQATREAGCLMKIPWVILKRHLRGFIVL